VASATPTMTWSHRRRAPAGLDCPADDPAFTCARSPCSARLNPG
jgi:hypothetical protein